MSFGSGNEDALLIKIDADGTIIWQKTFGAAYFERIHSNVALSTSGEILAAGEIKDSSGYLHDETSDVLVIRTTNDAALGGCAAAAESQLAAVESTLEAADQTILSCTPCISANTYIPLISQTNVPAHNLCESHTFVTLQFFRGFRLGTTAVLFWKTVAEEQSAGFRIYREDDPNTPINPILIPSRGSVSAGALHCYIDFFTPPGPATFQSEGIDDQGLATLLTTTALR